MFGLYGYSLLQYLPPTYLYINESYEIGGITALSMKPEHSSTQLVGRVRRILNLNVGGSFFKSSLPFGISAALQMRQPCSLLAAKPTISERHHCSLPAMSYSLGTLRNLLL
eukprot:GHVU01015555.1.p1 GENE.GHVU01015555.1~~GHVU01015555.1.p1  ORF type:complete len:111 (-),score=5.34 GHVU01015555.1:321-653(-)